jgi:hypothetical protein
MGRLVSDYTTKILNGGDVSAVDTLFSPRYVDHDPLPGQTITRDGVVEVCRLLHQPGGDAWFTLEEIVVEDTSAAYRLFGEGMIPRRTVAGRVDITHAVVRCVGLFHASEGRFVDRWGRHEIVYDR